MRPSASSSEMARARISASERSRKFLATGGFSHGCGAGDRQAARRAPCHDRLRPITLGGNKGRTAMTDSDLRRFLAARQDKYRSHDAKALAADHTVEGTVHSPIFATVVGRAAIEHAYASLFQVFPDWSVTFDEAILDGGRAAHPCHVTATHLGEFMGLPGTGR